MDYSIDNRKILETTVGDFPLDEYQIQLPNRKLSILHVAAMLSQTDESNFLLEAENPLPYGIALWSSTIALAHDIISRPEAFKGKKVLELGAGTGLPGIVAASFGANVIQTDKNNLAMVLCKRNCELNKIKTIEHVTADWTDWKNKDRFDWIIGSDIFYGIDMHPHLSGIFDSNLANGGRILISDPFRGGSFRLLESMEKSGWLVNISKWNVGAGEALRSIGVFEISRL